MSFDDVIMSGDVILQCFVLCSKIGKKRRCALSRNNERTWAYQIIELRPNVSCQNVVLLTMPQDESTIARQPAR